MKKFWKYRKIISIIVAICLQLIDSPALADTDDLELYIMDQVWIHCTDDQRKTLPLSFKARACGMTSDEFLYLARVVEAESDRSSNIEGKKMIAAVVLNRVNSSYFPNTISAVLNESGQFATTYGGWCYTESTQTSQWAIILAKRELLEGIIPDNLLFFNCDGYNYGNAYGYYGGNYFMTYS